MTQQTHKHIDRGTILEVIDDAIEQVAESDRLVCVISGKILRLKDLYFELGYEHGDALISEICENVARCLRDVDIFTRIDNNEFTLILPGLKNAGQPLLAVNKIIRNCGVMEFGKHEFRIKIAFGAALSTIDANNGETLLRSADIALRHAETNELEYVRFAECPVQTLPPVIQLEAELGTAIKSGDLSARFQPVIDVESGELLEIELMTEWDRGVDGAVEPKLFNEIADRSGLTMPLMGWQLNNALRECHEWQTALPRVRVSMNLTGKALLDPYLPETIKRTLGLWSTKERMLSIEVNEDAIMSDPETSMKVLRELHDNGVLIAIDDFGTGSSSLSYLKELPLDILKIDRSFVASMIENTANRQIVQTVIDLAHNFDLSVIAKGVADEETLDTLTLMGCQCAQGDFVGEAMFAADLGRWFEASPWEELPDPNDTAALFESDLTG